MTCKRRKKMSEWSDSSLEELQSETDSKELRGHFSVTDLARFCKLEKKRLRNLKLNYEMLKSLGLTVEMPDFMKPKTRCPQPVQKRHIQEKGYNSDTSDPDWTPDMDWEFLQRNREGRRLRNRPRRAKERVSRSLHPPQEDVRCPETRLSTKLSRYLPTDLHEQLYCPECGQDYPWECPDHGPLTFIEDTQTQGAERAWHTLPACLSVRQSSIPEAGLGVWANETIPNRTRFGPYKGDLITDWVRAERSGYCWKIGKGDLFVDAQNQATSNWLRYVNCCRNKLEQNLIAYQYRGQIFYKSIKDITRGTELLVWYGEDYGYELGIKQEQMYNSFFYPHRRDRGRVEKDICNGGGSIRQGLVTGRLGSPKKTKPAELYVCEDRDNIVESDGESRVHDCQDSELDCHGLSVKSSPSVDTGHTGLPLTPVTQVPGFRSSSVNSMPLAGEDGADTLIQNVWNSRLHPSSVRCEHSHSEPHDLVGLGRKESDDLTIVKDIRSQGLEKSLTAGRSSKTTICSNRTSGTHPETHSTDSVTNNCTLSRNQDLPAVRCKDICEGSGQTVQDTPSDVEVVRKVRNSRRPLRTKKRVDFTVVKTLNCSVSIPSKVNHSHDSSDWLTLIDRHMSAGIDSEGGLSDSENQADAVVNEQGDNVTACVDMVKNQQCAVRWKPNVEREPDVGSCETDVVKCKPDIVQCESNVVQCQPDIVQCESDIVQCQPDIAECESDVVQCQPDLQKSKSNVKYASESVKGELEIETHEPDIVTGQLINMEVEPENGTDDSDSGNTDDSDSHDSGNTYDCLDRAEIQQVERYDAGITDGGQLSGKLPDDTWTLYCSLNLDCGVGRVVNNKPDTCQTSRDGSNMATDWEIRRAKLAKDKKSRKVDGSLNKLCPSSGPLDMWQTAYANLNSDLGSSCRDLHNTTANVFDIILQFL